MAQRIHQPIFVRVMVAMQAPATWACNAYLRIPLQHVETLVLAKELRMVKLMSDIVWPQLRRNGRLA